MKSGSISIGGEMFGIHNIAGEGYIMPMTEQQEAMIENSKQFEMGLLVETDTDLINKKEAETLERNSLLNRLEGIVDADTLKELENVDDETKQLLADNINEILGRKKAGIEESNVEFVSTDPASEGDEEIPVIKPVDDINKVSNTDPASEGDEEIPVIKPVEKAKPKSKK